MRYLTVLILALLLVACSGEKSAFNRAEKELTSGRIENAIGLFEQFIQKYPASNLRDNAEKEIDISNKLLNLKNEGVLLADSGMFDEARNAYRQMNKIRPGSIDTSALFIRLKEREEKYWREAPARNEKYIANADSFIADVVTSKKIIYSALLYYDLMSGAEWAFKEGLDTVMRVTSVARSSIREDFLLLKHPTATEQYLNYYRLLANVFNSFEEFLYTVENSRKYPRRFFMTLIKYKYDQIDDAGRKAFYWGRALR